MDLLPWLQHISSSSGLFYFNSLHFEYYFDRVCTDRSWDNCTVWAYVSPQMHVRVAGEKWKMPGLCEGSIFLCALLLHATQFPLHSTWHVCSLLKMHCHNIGFVQIIWKLQCTGLLHSGICKGLRTHRRPACGDVFAKHMLLGMDYNVLLPKQLYDRTGSQNRYRWKRV